MSSKSHIIPNVPRVAMFVNETPYLTPFIGSLYAAVHAMGGEESYAEILALSGAGNRLRWAKGWDPSNVDILNCEEPAFAPLFRALNAVGRQGSVNLAQPFPGHESPLVDEATARKDILASLDQDIPVIAMGIIGPPECCVVSGYDNNGDVLVGWNYFQTEEGFDPGEPFRKAAWFAKMRGYILLAQRTEKPSLHELGYAALKAIVKHAHTAEVRGAAVGLAAWQACLDQLEFDDFSDCPILLPQQCSGDDAAWQSSVQGRFIIYCDALCQIHERHVALPGFRKLAAAVPEWSPELEAAIELWDGCASYGGYLWQHVGLSALAEQPDNKAALEEFRKPETRKILADEGRRCLELERQAIGRIEALLARIAQAQ